jgi:ribosome-associated protein
MIEVNERVFLPDSEVEFHVSSSSGPGGQNVNRVRTRVTLRFDVGASVSLTDEQKARIFARLRTRINKEGVLQVHSQRHRSQEMNRAEAERRLGALLGEAIEEIRPRRKTRVPSGSRKRRREDKQRRSRVKETRSPGNRTDDQ